jgi:hypothetical protein
VYKSRIKCDARRSKVNDAALNIYERNQRHAGKVGSIVSSVQDLYSTIELNISLGGIGSCVQRNP